MTWIEFYRPIVEHPFSFFVYTVWSIVLGFVIPWARKNRKW